MSKLEIRLEEGSLDLSPDSETKFYITKQIHDIRNLETRKASFSKSIDIPRTPNNVRILNTELYEFGRDSVTSYAFKSCTVFLADYPTLTDGRLIVTSQDTTKNTITIGIFGGTVTMFELLSDDGLSALPLTDYSFQWNLTNIQNYVDVTDGLLFGNSTWFSNDNYTVAVQDGLTPEINLSTPELKYNGAWFYVKTLMQMIFDTMPEITIDNSVLEALDDYDKMVVMIPTTKLLDNFTATVGFSGLVNQSLGNAEFEGSLPPPITAVFPSILEDEPAGFWNVTNNEYEVSEASFYSISLNLDIQAYGLTTIFGYGFVRIVNGTTTVYEKTIRSKNVTIDENLSIFLNAGDKLRVELGGELSENTTGFYYSGSFGCTGTGAVVSNFVDIAEFMPDISQKDFVKEIFKLFHAIPTFQDGVTSITLWDEIQTNPEEDLTQYLDESRAIVERGYINGYAQNNSLEFTVDETVDRQGTSLTFPMGNEILPLSATKVKSLFSPSDQSKATGYSLVSTPLMPFEYEKFTTNKIGTIVNSFTYITESPNDLKVGDLIFAKDVNGNQQGRRRVTSITDDRSGLVDTAWASTTTKIWERIRYSKQDVGLRFGKTTQLGTTTIRDGGQSVSVSSMKGVEFPDAYQWDELGASYYGNLISMLEKTSVKLAWFRLPPSVFNDLNLLKPIYLKDRAYYINKIEQYNFSGFCRVELVEYKNVSTPAPFPFYTVIPNPLDFGAVASSSVTNKKVTIKNSGAGSIEFQVNPITGTDASYYAFNPPISNPFTIAQGDQKEIFIDFTADTSFSSREAQFVVESLTPDIYDVTVGMDAQIKSDADYYIAPVSVVFTPTPDGFVTQAETTIYNSGLGSIDFNLSAVSGSAEFTYSAGQPTSFTIPEGGSQVVSLDFNSILPYDQKSALFTVQSITPDIQDTLVEVFGNTTTNPATYTVNPNPLDFGLRANNAPDITLFTTVENTGRETINFTLSTITGPNANEFDFAIGQPTSFSLDAGQTEQIQITWDTANPKTFKQAFFTVEANHEFGTDTVVEVNGTTI